MAGKLSVARMKALLSGNSMTSVSTSGDSTVGSGLVLSDAGVLTAPVLRRGQTSCGHCAGRLDGRERQRGHGQLQRDGCRHTAAGSG